MNTANITAAPIELDYGDEKFMYSPMTDGDYGEFERFVQRRFIEVATQNIDLIPQENRQGILNHAYDKAAAIIFTSPDALTIMRTVDGVAFRTYLGVRRNHPEVTYEKIRKLSTSAAQKTLADIIAKMEFVDNDRTAKPVESGSEKKNEQQESPVS